MLFPDETWQTLKTFVILCHQIFFEFFWTFLDFTTHGGSVRAKTRMGTFQHFFHECKWHWHIGDVFLNILVSYLHFSDLVWISYEVFKLTVKRSKGKSIRGAKWLGQNRWLLGIRGKTDEWDTTRGINLIIPLMNGTFQLRMHVIDSIYEWFSSHFLECEYRSSIASIRSVYEVATSHWANLI